MSATHASIDLALNLDAALRQDAERKDTTLPVQTYPCFHRPPFAEVTGLPPKLSAVSHHMKTNCTT